MNDFETTKQVSPLTNSELGREALKPIKEMIDRQEPLPPEMAKILYDNLWSLYEEAALSAEVQPEVTGAVAVYSGDHDGDYGMIEYLVHQGARLKVGDKLYTTEAIQEAVNAKSEALKERDRLGYAVVQLVEAVDALLEAGSDEYLHDENGDFTYEEAPSDYWADLRTAADNMVLRAEDFEEKYRALMESPQPSVEEPAN